MGCNSNLIFKNFYYMLVEIEGSDWKLGGRNCCTHLQKDTIINPWKLRSQSVPRKITGQLLSDYIYGYGAASMHLLKNHSDQLLALICMGEVELKTPRGYLILQLSCDFCDHPVSHCGTLFPVILALYIKVNLACVRRSYQRC